jgi:hypothetical protein
MGIPNLETRSNDAFQFAVAPAPSKGDHLVDHTVSDATE